MSIASWVYDHAPKSVQDWMDNRTIQREAEERYPSPEQQRAEAESVWGDRRKANIESGIPLTPEQQKQQDRIDGDTFYRAMEYLRPDPNVTPVIEPIQTGDGSYEYPQPHEIRDMPQPNIWDESVSLPDGYSLMRFENGDRQLLTFDGEILNLKPEDKPWGVALAHEDKRLSQEFDPADDVKVGYFAKMAAEDGHDLRTLTVDEQRWLRSEPDQEPTLKP